MIKKLSIQQARKIVLHSQKLPPINQKGNALAATFTAIENLGYIQIDTISAIQRAHHHTLWNRNPKYKNSHIDQLLKDKKIFEYWSHAAAYLPMKDFRFSLIRKHALLSGKDNHWFVRDEKLMNYVLHRIANEGPLLTRDFKNSGKKIGEWGSKPTKQALENLYMQGDLMIPYRVNFHKVYDLTERVIPDNVDTTLPNKEQYARYLIIRYLQANGLGQVAEISYLLKNIKLLITETLQEMVLNNELIQVFVGENTYYALPDVLELLNKPLAKSKLKILSPFDNFLIQRKRMKYFFDFDYQLECYLPADKRKYGYFSLPILYEGKLVARMDCKAERKLSLLQIHNIILEPSLKKMDDFVSVLCKELKSFMLFNNCKNVRVNNTTPINLKSIIESEIEGMKI